MIRDLGSKLCLADATCKRMLCSNGGLFETVDFKAHHEGPDELTEEELDRWVESFPVQILGG
jgi:flavodoxin